MSFYEVRPRKNHRSVDLISDALPFGRLCYGEPNAASNVIGYALHHSRSHDAVIRVYHPAGKRDRDARAQGRVQRVLVAIYVRDARSIITEQSAGVDQDVRCPCRAT